MNLILIIIGLFILGSIFGSLGSVLVTRLGEGVNRHILHGICFGFSQCPKCKKQLKPRNLIPILSFFLQRGMCEHCKEPISTFYPTLEILSGLTFVTTYLGGARVAGRGTGTMIFFLIINRLLLLLIVYDFQKLELHVPLRGVALSVSLLGQFIFPIGNYGQAFFLSFLLGGICVGLFYAAKWYVKIKYKSQKDATETIGTLNDAQEDDISEGFGQGDVMLGFLLGTLLPFVFSFNQLSFSWMRVVELLILFFVVSSLLGIVRYGIIKLTTNNEQLTIKNNWRSDYSLFTVNCSLHVLPFIPFMIFSFWILLFAGTYFINLLFPRG